MAKKSAPAPAPVTFELTEDLIDHLEAQRKKLGLKSLSETVRHALESFQPADYAPTKASQRQISVRLPAAQKTTLTRVAKKHKVSVGRLVRDAVEAFSAKRAKR